MVPRSSWLTTEAKRSSALGARVVVASVGLLGVGVLVGATAGARSGEPLRHLPAIPHLVAAPPPPVDAKVDAMTAGARTPAEPATEPALEFAEAFDVSTFQKGNI